MALEKDDKVAEEAFQQALLLVVDKRPIFSDDETHWYAVSAWNHAIDLHWYSTYGNLLI